jgi:hypothetical protein
LRQKKAEELSEGNSGQVDEKKRRVRRSAVDIARHYKCQIEGCTKSYGYECGKLDLKALSTSI